MKKLIFAFSFLLCGVFSVNAQSSCCAKKSADGKVCSAKTEKTTKVASAYMEIDKLVDADENLQKRVCSATGTQTYFQKSTCSTTGKIAWEEVKYDADSESFTKVASAVMERTEDGTVKTEKKACASGKACCSKKAGA